MVKLSIIIPSFNTKEMTVELLKSLKHLKETEIIVVDNGSEDGSVRDFGKFGDVRVIKNEKNLGFAKAINQGLKEAQGEFILLLNSDTEVTEETVNKMIDYLENNPKVGVVGPQLRHSDGTIQPSGGYLPNLLNIFFWMLFLDDLPIIKNFFPAYHLENINFYKKERKLGWVTGAFFLTKKEVIRKVGLFDESIFMYVEEVDFCKRVQEAGYKVVFNPISSIVHYKGASSVHLRAGIVEEFNGLKYFFKKHNSGFEQLLLRVLLKIGSLGRFLLFGIILQDAKDREIYEKAFRLA